jgi:RHS repeat-associated protein
MFTISNRQIEALSALIRKRKRAEIYVQLSSNGYDVFEGEDNELYILNGKGKKTQIVFDKNYVPKKIVRPSGLEYTLSFDKEDNLIRISLPGNEIISFVYQDKLLAAIILNENRTSLVYDGKGRICEVILHDKKGYKISYNTAHQIETIINRANEKRQFSSGIKEGVLVHSIKDPLGRMTQIETEPLGSLKERIIFPDGSKQTSIYDDNLDALVTTLRSGSRRYDYYDNNVLEHVQWTDDYYMYVTSAANQIHSMINPAGTLQFFYDDQNKITAEKFLENKVNYEYDADGIISAIIYPSGLTINYEYDEDSRLEKISVRGETFQISYADNDTIQEIRYPNKLTQKRKEKNFGGLQSSIICNTYGDELSKQSYQYDALFRLIAYDSAYNSNKILKNWRLEYDDEWRLLNFSELRNNITEQFKYDKKGNLISENRKAIYVGKMDEVLLHGSQKITYDSNGNVSSFTDAKGRNVLLTFNQNNELKLATIGNETWEYWYDSLGRRVGKSNGKITWKYCWADAMLISEEKTYLGEVSLREYIYGPFANIPIGFEENSKRYWMHSDVRGAITHVYNSEGQEVWIAAYTAFGDAQIISESIRQPWRLAGQYLDDETGLHYSTARYYSTYLKSFLSVDRYWYEYEASNYSYAANDPFNKIDTDGNLATLLVAALPVVKAIAIKATIYAAKTATAQVFKQAASAALGSLLDNLIKGEDLCWSCATKKAVEGGKNAFQPMNLKLALATNGLVTMPRLRLISNLYKKMLQPNPNDATRKYNEQDGKFISCPDGSKNSNKPFEGKIPTLTPPKCKDSNNKAKAGCLVQNGPIPEYVFVNGVNNTPEQNCSASQALANTLGAKVHSFYNATDKLWRDLAEALQSISNEETRPAKNLAKYIETHEGEEINIIAHSQGGLITRQALTIYRKNLEGQGVEEKIINEKMSKINIIICGSAKKGFPEGPNYTIINNEKDNIAKIIQAADDVYMVKDTNAKLHKPLPFSDSSSDGLMGHGMEEVYVKKVAEIKLNTLKSCKACN